MQVSSQASPTSETLETIALDVQGMRCAGCVKVVETQLQSYPGVISACVNLVTEVAAVEYQSGKVEPAALAARLTEAGFPTQPRHTHQQVEESEVKEKQRAELKQQIQQLIIAATLIILSGIGHLSQHAAPLTNIGFHWGLATLAFLFPGRSILIDGWRGLLRNAPNMNTLVGLGAFSAYTASCVAFAFPQLGWECFFDEPVMLLGFILLGRTLEKRARDQAASSLRSLLSLQPQQAKLITNPDNPQAIIEVPAYSVRVGEWLKVLPGEKIPVDGEVVTGQTVVDESMLTGESLPIPKQAQDWVSAGTLNQSGSLIIQAKRTGRETTLAQIVAVVEDAQTRKAPVQQLADTIAGYFTYGVMSIATLTFIFWYGWGSRWWPEVLIDSLNHSHGMAMATVHPSPLLLSLKLAIAVLVIACPCALGLATPTAVLVGTGLGAEQGILIKGGDVLQRIHTLDTVVFDKTGTLTTGQPTLTDILPLQHSTSELLTWAATVECNTNHPLAKAIVQAAKQAQLNLPLATDLKTELGLGVSGQVAGQTVILGTRDWLAQHQVSLEPEWEEQALSLASSGKTVIYMAVDQGFAGIFAIADPVRRDAQATVSQLQQMGLEVVMITGDRTPTAQAIASQLGIDHIYSEVKPSQKADLLATLQANGAKSIAMVGDGINDAPALAKADVGIALCTGTDVAIETAQLVLMRDRLSDVVKALQLGRATFAKIRQNLFWAFVYNSVGIPVAAGVLLPSMGILLAPGAAGALMAFSSVSVVTNSLLLRLSLAFNQPDQLDSPK